MRAFLLAAGVGSRISEHIGRIPKSMLEINGQPLIVHTVELLQKNQIEVTILTGYRHNMIEDALKDYNVRIFYNPFYAATNSIGSLWYARNEIDAHEVLIANADVYYTQELLDEIFACRHDVVMLDDTSRAEVGDYFFLTENGVLKKYGKELKSGERTSEYVGLCCLRNNWVSRFRERLCEMVENGEYNLWWENVLYSYVEDYPIYTLDVNGIFWSEVDTISDYQRVLDHCSGKDQA